jgi:rapamycin-insensitive companion of mTOR
MQALKILKKFLDIAPNLFPIGFARSLVAIAAEKSDNFRRVSLETLRELGIKNPAVAHEADVFRVLFDAVIDPTTSELSETILLSMLHLLNSAETRKYVRPQLDLQCLVILSSFLFFYFTVISIH